jgi:ABC-type siderophore export system fused ATPase/permease subunit
MAQKALAMLREWRDERKMSFQKIADKMNELKIKPSRAKKWYASTVRAVLESRMASEVA